MEIQQKKYEVSDIIYSVGTVLSGKIKKGGNEIRHLKDCYISYNPDTDCGAETALVYKDKFFILLGDFRNELKNCLSVFECIKVYKKLIKEGAEVSVWSNYTYK